MATWSRCTRDNSMKEIIHINLDNVLTIVPHGDYTEVLLRDGKKESVIESADIVMMAMNPMPTRID